MTKIVFAILAAAPLALFATPSIAHDRAAAVASSESALRVAPHDGGAVIELANSYALAGREADARNAYRQALTLDNVMLETRHGDSIWSHQVARRALAGPVTLSAR